MAVAPFEVRASTRTLETVPADCGDTMFETIRFAAGQLPPLQAAASAARAARHTDRAMRIRTRTMAPTLRAAGTRIAGRDDGKPDVHLSNKGPLARGQDSGHCGSKSGLSGESR